MTFPTVSFNSITPSTVYAPKSAPPKIPPLARMYGAAQIFVPACLSKYTHLSGLLTGCALILDTCSAIVESSCKRICQFDPEFAPF